MVENVIQIKREITINVDASVKIQENIVYAKKNYSWNPNTSSWEELGLSELPPSSTSEQDILLF